MCVFEILSTGIKNDLKGQCVRKSKFSMKNLLLLMLFMLSAWSALAQNVVSGVVLDSSTGKQMVGVAVTILTLPINKLVRELFISKLT